MQEKEDTDPDQIPLQAARRNLMIVLILMFAVSVAVLGLMWAKPPAADTIGMEIAKAVIQIGLVSVAGGILAMLSFIHQSARAKADRDNERELNNREKERDRWRRQVEYRDTLLQATLEQTTASYNDVKSVRRLMRARGLKERDGRTLVQAANYDEAMVLINDRQLEFERLVSDVVTSSKAFSSDTELRGALRRMEAYLGAVIKEYEGKRKLFAGDPPELALEELPQLSHFLARAKQGFSSGFARHHSEVRRIIRADLLHPQLPEALIAEQDGSLEGRT